MKRNILPLLSAIFYSGAVFSQTPVTKGNVAAPTAASFFKSSVSYLSNAVYQGRKDSAVISYITPSINYVNKHGFNITGALSYAPNSGINEIELVSIEAGYEHRFNSSFSGNAFAAAYFYNQFSTAVQAEKTGGAGFGIDYSPKDIFVLSADMGVSISKKPDIATSVSLGHPFYFGSEGHDWSIVPHAAMVAGTQDYYQNYYTNIKFNRAIRAKQGIGRGIGNREVTSSSNNSTSSTTLTIVSARGFKVMSYEFAIPINYDEKKWGLFFTSTYAVPVNPLTYTESGSATPITEHLTNSFYIAGGGYVKF